MRLTPGAPVPTCGVALLASTDASSVRAHWMLWFSYANTRFWVEDGHLGVCGLGKAVHVTVPMGKHDLARRYVPALRVPWSLDTRRRGSVDVTWLWLGTDQHAFAAHFDQRAASAGTDAKAVAVFLDRLPASRLDPLDRLAVQTSHIAGLGEWPGASDNKTIRAELERQPDCQHWIRIFIRQLCASPDALLAQIGAGAVTRVPPDRWDDVHLHADELVAYAQQLGITVRTLLRARNRNDQKARDLLDESRRAAYAVIVKQRVANRPQLRPIHIRDGSSR